MYRLQTPFFWSRWRNAFTHASSRGEGRGYVGLALFNGPYPLKPQQVSYSGVNGGEPAMI